MDFDLPGRECSADCWTDFYFYVLFLLPSAVEGGFWLTSLVLLVQVKVKIADFLFMLSGTNSITHVFQLRWSDDRGHIFQYFLSIFFSYYVNG